MIGGFRLFGSRPKSQKMAADIEKFTQEEKQKMLERLNTLREKQREATRIITENAKTVTRPRVSLNKIVLNIG